MCDKIINDNNIVRPVVVVICTAYTDCFRISRR